jgi:hypothetical protein
MHQWHALCAAPQYAHEKRAHGKYVQGVLRMEQTSRPNQSNRFNQPNQPNRSIICWKWEDASLGDSLKAKALDLSKRFRGDLIFVMNQWMRRGFFDAEAAGYYRWYADFLHRQGKKLIVEACVRKEGADFFKIWPSERAWLMKLETVTLDEYGNGHLDAPVTPVSHYWRISGEHGPERVFGAWVFWPDGVDGYIPDSLHGIAARVFLEHGFGEAGDPRKTCSLTISAGKEYAGMTAVVALGTAQPIPDPASPHLMEHFQKMADHCRDMGLDGMASDEWGYDVILKIETENPYDDRKLSLSHLSVSDAFALRYQRAFPGHFLYEDLLHFFYHPADHREVKIAAVNRYLSVFRSIMRRNDEEMHRIVKETLGAGAFWGIHPTWWGSVDKQYFEVLKNAFYWWEASRDIAQTDENVIMPIRSALAHKWGSPYWYNMWYSMGSRDINTYFADTWMSFRYGGRTHYLGYECPNEAVVLEVKGNGMLEALEEMEERVRLFEAFQKSALDCRVLVLFGMEAVCNWSLGDRPMPPWVPESPPLYETLRLVHHLHDKLLCDLAPTTEIVNGSLSLADGIPRYNTQTYDAVVLLKPECMDAACYMWLRKLKTPLLLFEDATMYNSSAPLSSEDRAWLTVHRTDADFPDADHVAGLLLNLGIAPNRVENGCVFQDGSLLFTAEGARHIDNPLRVAASLGGVDVDFCGHDYLWLSPKENGGWFAFSPTPGTLRVDGINIPVMVGLRGAGRQNNPK